MRFTLLKVGVIVVGTVGFYTLLANSIPQVESDVPKELSFTGAVTPEQLVAAGSELYQGAGGCTACHGLGTRAPNLLADEGGTGQIGARCSSRVPGQNCKEYLHRSLVKPSDFVVAGYQPIMPDMSRTLTPTQIWALVAYLESLGGTVTVSASDLPSDNENASAAPAAASATAATASLDAREILNAQQCLLCHKLGAQGGAIGPALDGVGRRLNKERIRTAILLPNADTAKGYEHLAGTMPANFGTQLNAAQLEALVVFLAGQR
jgi:mono/diheme cytochrome c family protein